MPGNQETASETGPAGRGKNPVTARPLKRKITWYVSLALVCLLLMIVIFISFPTAKTRPEVRLTGVNWTLESLTDGTGIHIPAGSGSVVTAEFSPTGRVTGNSGCNWYSFRFTTQGNLLNISLESVTDMRCWDPGTAAQEAAFLKDMAAAASFRTGGSSLYIDDAAGKTVLVFRVG
jgi:heat shock protein HslJ